jgi:hypothetical protein
MKVFGGGTIQIKCDNNKKLCRNLCYKGGGTIQIKCDNNYWMVLFFYLIGGGTLQIRNKWMKQPLIKF